MHCIDFIYCLDAAQLSARNERDLNKQKRVNVFGFLMTQSKNATSLPTVDVGDLARERKVLQHKPRGAGKHQPVRTCKVSATVLSKSFFCIVLQHTIQTIVLLQQRMKEFPDEPFASVGSKETLFCEACKMELSTIKSSIEDHIRRPKHKTNVEATKQIKADSIRISKVPTHF